VATPISGAKPTPVAVSFAPPEPQNRLTVGFRFLLAVPHILFFLVLVLVAEVVVTVGWFAALILGRLPDGLFDLLSGVVRYATRLYAYNLLVTDRYPPFSEKESDYPVEVEFTRSRLNRLAVLFRIFLVLPAALLAGVVTSGLSIAAFFIWLVVLVTGRMPRSLFEGVAATLRYQTRYYAYLALVTPAYPGGLLGDRDESAASNLGTARAGDEFGPGPASAPEASTSQETPGAPPPPAPPDARVGAPRATKLVLSKAGTRVVGLFIFLGLLYYGGTVAFAVVSAGSTVNRQEAVLSLNDSYATLTRAVRQFQTESGACSSAGGLTCIEAADGRLATSFDKFSNDMSSTNFPSSSRVAADRLESVSSRLATLLHQVATVQSVADYRAQFSQFQPLGSEFDRDYHVLRTSLV